MHKRLKAKIENKLMEKMIAREEGHAAAWGGGSLVGIILLVILLVLIF